MSESSEKIKLIFAIGDEQVEEYLSSRLPDYITIVGAVSFRGGVLSKLDSHFSKNSKGIVILREAFDSSGMPMTELCESIRANYPYIRIIFMAGNHLPGDELMLFLSNHGIYDVVAGEKIQVLDVVDCIEHPRNYADMACWRGIESSISRPEIEENSEDVPIVITQEVPKKKRLVFPRTIISDEPAVIKNPEPPVKTEPIAKMETPIIEEDVAPEIEETKVLTSQDLEAVMQKVEPKEDVLQENQLVKKKQGNTAIFKPYKNKPVKDTKVPVLEAPHNTVMLSFTGTGYGVGNRELSFNTALSLASNKKDVLYIDITRDFPSLLCRLDVTNDHSVCDFLHLENLDKFEKYRLNLHDMGQMYTDSYDKNRLEKLPQGLDVLCCSTEKYGENISFDALEEYLYRLKKTPKYDYVVIVHSGLFNPEYIKVISKYCSINFVTLSQFSVTTRIALEVVTLLKQSLAKDIRIIVNRAEKTRPTVREIAEVFEVETCYSVVSDNKGFLSADAACVPYVYLPKANNKVLSSIAAIVSSIL